MRVPAPEPVPADWFPRAANRLPGPLAAAGADTFAWRKVMARIGAQALARLDQRGLVMHRLTQTIARSTAAGRGGSGPGGGGSGPGGESSW